MRKEQWNQLKIIWTDTQPDTPIINNMPEAIFMEEVVPTFCHSVFGNNCCLEWFWPIFGSLFILLISTYFFAIEFSNAEGWEFNKARYFTIITATTIGYGDFTPETEYGKWISIILIYTSSLFLMSLFQHIITAFLKGGGFNGLDIIFCCFCRYCCKEYCGDDDCCRIRNYEENENHWGILEKIDYAAENHSKFEDLKEKLNKRMVIKLISEDTLEDPKFNENRESAPIIDILTQIYKVPINIANPKSEDNENDCLKFCHDKLCCPRGVCDFSTFSAFIISTCFYLAWFWVWIIVFTNQTYGNDTFNLSDTIYFGVVTSATVGYGDFSPYGNGNITNSTSSISNEIIIYEYINCNINNTNSTYNPTSIQTSTTSPSSIFISGFWGDDIVQFITVWSVLGVVLSITWINLLAFICSGCFNYICMKIWCDGDTTNSKCCCFCIHYCSPCTCVTVYDQILRVKTNNVLFYLQDMGENIHIEDDLPKYILEIKREAKAQRNALRLARAQAAAVAAAEAEAVALEINNPGRGNEIENTIDEV